MNVLYIIMRNDLDSMNCGKAIAQGSHASNAFIDKFHSTMQEYSVDSSAKEKAEKLNKDVREWETSTTQGFGTVLVLEAPMTEIYDSIENVRDHGYLADIVHDPTYPIKDGSVVHHLPLDTCAYVFVPDFETDIKARNILSTFKLHH